MKPEYDLIVVGAGGAGLAAALTARQAGIERVIVIDAEGIVGGSTRLSSGVVMAAGTKLQATAGILDSGEALFHDYLSWNNFDVQLGPVSTLCARSGETVDWLGDVGVAFDARVVRCAMELNFRGHCAHGKGQAIVDALHAAGRESGIEFALSRRVGRLLVEDGDVVGVMVDGEPVRARAVVVATGGFGANPEKLKKYHPSAWVDELSFFVGSRGAQGDAVDLAGDVDADLVGFDTGLRMVTADVYPDRLLEPILPGWSMVVDARGRRFVDESIPYGILDLRFRAVGDLAYLIFDDTAMRPPNELAAAYRHAYRADWPHVDRPQPRNWVAERVDIMVDAGRVQRADTIEALARQLRLPEDAFAAEVERYNAMVDSGFDADQMKPAEFLRKIDRAPFYGTALRPAAISQTAYGFRIDEAARVLDRSGAPIRGLFAGGECTGGVLGPAYLGSGNSLMNALTMGRVAGDTAAVYALRP